MQGVPFARPWPGLSGRFPHKLAHSRATPWVLAGGVPLLFAPAWMWLWQRAGQQSAFSTFAALILVLTAASVVWTDLRSRRIPNWITYTAAAWGLGLNAVAAIAATPGHAERLGAVGLASSLGGLLGLGFVMFCIFSVSGGGAGDVKLAAAIGALLGLGRGVDAVAYAMTLAGVALLLLALLRYGPLAIVRTAVRSTCWTLVPRWISPPTDADRRLLQSEAPLGPFFALGVVLVLLDGELNFPMWGL